MKSNVLLVGLATVDIVNMVAEYPGEDEETRALEQRASRGGNASNTAVVLRQLGRQCAFAGVLVRVPQSAVIFNELDGYGIDTEPSRFLSQGMPPTSYVTSSRRTGSRTIVHYRDVPDYGYNDFAKVDPAGYEWVHFEGRNVEDTIRMIARTRVEEPRATISIEIEKPRPGAETRLFPLGDILLFSRSYALARRYEDPSRFLAAMREHAPNAILICSWGERGAVAFDAEDREYSSPAFPPRRVADTIGAGDTFNAGIIHSMLGGHTLGEALIAACKLAGSKCGVHGLHGVVSAE